MEKDTLAVLFSVLVLVLGVLGFVFYSNKDKLNVPKRPKKSKKKDRVNWSIDG